MAKLAGDSYVTFQGVTYAPGDKLPKELNHLADADDADDVDDPGTFGTTAEGAVFNVEVATGPQLRDFLGNNGVAFASNERIDALREKAAAVIEQKRQAGESNGQ